MSPHLPRPIQAVAYEEAAQAYLRSLPLEHFMEGIGQATQREITLASLALLKPHRPDLHVFNEMLLQYPLRGRRNLGQVVPDNMAVLTKERIRASTSYNVPLEPCGPFWVMEYVSKNNRRKDYEESFRKYERDLKVPYYLVFYPDDQEMTLYRHNKRRYVTVRPNENGRYPIPELELEVGLYEGWVRFWHKGKLLPLPAEMQRDLDEVKRQADEAKRQADEAKRQADEAKRQAEEERRRAEEERRRADELQRQLNALRSRLDQQ